MLIKKITRAIAFTALFLIPVFPLIVMNDFFFPFITGKAFYFRLLVEIAFASWIILAFLDARYRPRLNVTTISITVFALVALAADLLGVNPLRSIWSNFERMEGWITIVHVWAFFIVATSIFGGGAENDKAESRKRESIKWWHRWFKTSLIVSVIVAGYGFVQLFGWAAIHQGSTRIDASLGNAIYMAVYMLFHSFLSAYFFFRAKQNNGPKFELWIYGIYSLITAFLLFETATRGTILGLIGGVMLALFLYAVLGKNEPKKNRWISAGIIGAIILVGAIFWTNRDSTFVQDHETLRRLAGISWNETKTQARAYVWPMAIKGWSERPILGWGQENFNYVFNANYDPRMWSQEQWFDRAHNIYLDWLINAGIVGLIVYLTLYVVAFRLIWKSKIPLSQKSVLTGLVGGYMIHNIFVFDSLVSYVLFFAILGFVASLDKDNNTKEIVVGGNKEARSEIVEYVVAPVSIIALLLVIFFVQWRPLQANTKLIAGLRSCYGPTPDITILEKVISIDAYVANQEIREQLLGCASSIISNQQVAGPTKQAFFQLALEGINDQIATAPKDARMYVLGGNFLDNVGQLDQARPLLEKAHALTPRKQSLALELVMNYANNGSLDKALALSEETYKLETNHTQARIAYAVILVVSGQENKAIELFGNDPVVFNSTQMAQAYTAIQNYNKASKIYENMISANPSNLDLRANLAQTQYRAGLKSQAVQTLNKAIQDFPEYKSAIQNMIDSLK